MVLETAPKLKEYISLNQFNLLKKYKKLGTLGKKQLTRNLWLTAQEAKELGYNAGEEDFLLTPTALKEGALYGGLLEPTIAEPRSAIRGEPITATPTMAKEGDNVPSMLKLLYPEKIKTLPSADEDLLFKEYQRTGGEYDIDTWRLAGLPLRPEMEFDYLQDLNQRATPEEGEAILRGLGATEEDIDQFIGIEKRQAELEGLVAKTFPGYDLEGFANLVETDPDKFVEQIKVGGWTKDKENLLRMMGVKDEDIPKIIAPWWTLDFWMDAFFKPYGGKDLKGKAAASFVAGIGDVISTTGGAARWLGYEEAGGVLSTIGSTLQRVAPPDTLGEFEMGDLLNPEFYATKITRTVPFSLSLLPLAIGGYGGGAAVATYVGLGRIGSAIVGGLAGAALSRPLESAMEAGGAYDDAIARGKSEKEAKDEADKVFRDNMVMAGADAFQIAIALAPTPKWVPSSLVKAGLVRTARIGGKMVIVGLSEGGEEVYQDMVTRHARGEEWQLDPVSKEVFAIGAVMGLGMGLGGDVVSGIVDKAKTQMSSSLRSRFNAEVVNFETQGFTTRQSELKALDTVSDIPEGGNLISRLIKEAVAEVKARPERGAIEIPGKKPEEVAPTPEVTKQPWQMTKAEATKLWQPYKAQFDMSLEEYLAKHPNNNTAEREWRQGQKSIAGGIEGQLRIHKESIKKALSEGKPVPAEVLKDYPELKPVTPTAPVTPEVIDKRAPIDVVIRKEPERLYPSGVKYVAYQEDGTPLYLAEETLEAVKARVGQAYNVKSIRMEGAPTAPAQTWTEAGIQPSMLPEEVAAIEIRPPGKGKITQISMDDQLKLEQARRAAEEAPEEVREAYEAQAEIESIKYTLQTDPVASLRFKIGNRSYSIDNIVDAKEKTFAYNDSFTLSQAKAIKPNVVFSEANKLPNGRIRADAVLDELAQRYTGGDVNAFIARVNQIRQEKARITELERQAVGIEAGLPYLSVPEETTLPMPDEVKASEDRIIIPEQPKDGAEGSWEYFTAHYYDDKPPTMPPPPTIHPPQPAPIEAGRITMPDLQAPQLVVDMYSKPDFWRRVANLPLVRKAVGLFNPAAVANNPAQQAIILRAVLKDEGAQKAQAVMSHLWEIGTQERVWGKTDEYGYLKAEQFAGFTMDDIRTNPTKFLATMTEQQREWIKRASEIEKVKLEALKRNEIEINELSFEDGGEYAGRRVMGKFNDAGELIESGRIGVGGRVGAKQAFEKTRVFKTAEEGILANYRYMNTDEALYYNTIGAYNKIADRQMADWILSKVDWRTTKAPEALVLQAEAARLRLRKAQQLLAALNRAVRGERVPSNTINSIASVYADQADTLKTLIPELQKPAPETGEIVQTLTNEAKALISEAKVEYYQAVNERARAREEAMRVKYEEASIAHPAFAGKIFTGAEAKEIADILNRGLSPQFFEALGAVNKVNAIGRFFMLAGDASPMAIQLQFLAFYRPKAYAKAWGGFVRAMFDPEFQYRQYANNRDLINRHPTLILSGRGTEFTEFMGRGGLGKKLGVLAKPLVPFQKAFEGCLDTAGIELAKSLDHLCTTPEATLQVDQFINEFRGITSSSRIGVSSTQRQVETAILLAPRYNRAIAAYLFDIVHGGLRGELARMSLAQGFAGLSAMAVAISIALGEDDDEIWQHFNPESPKFFTWDVMGVKIGPGGKVRSVLKTFGNMLRTGEVGQPALNFLRGNLSPGASTGLDLLTGKNYIGEPTRDNVLDFTKTVGRNFMMIWTQTFLMEGGTLKDKALIATAEFLGLRGYDISAKKELKIKDLEERLGEVVGKTPVLTKKKPDIYDCRNIFSDVKNLLKNIPPEDVLADKGYAGWGHLVVKIQQSEANSLPNIAFKDYNFDKEKGDTFADYMTQWAERQRIEEAGERATYTRVKIVEGKEERTTFKGLEALNAHKVDYPNAQRGNLSKRDRGLLLEYNVAADKKQFIKEHPEIKVNRLTDWFKANPRENALFALVGQADILSKEAYSEFQKIIKEMDILDAAVLPQTLPPESSLDTHFSYMDKVAEGTHPSWEAQLLIKQDALKAEEAGVQSYADWKELKLSDTPIASLELKVKNRENFDKLDAFSNKDLSEYIIDDKARAEAIKKFRADNPEFVDDTRRIEAIEKGTDENPIDDKLVSAHVEYGQLIDQEGIGSSSAEAMLHRVDNPDYDAFRTDTTIWDKQALTPIDRSRIPIWRIDVKYRKEDAEYNAIKNPLPKEQARLRAEYMASHEDYRKDDRRREAYSLSNSKTGENFPPSEVENYVQYFEYPAKGFRRERMCYDDFGNLNAFGKAMHEVVGNDIKPFNEIPDATYDDIYDQYPDQFDEIEGLSVNTSRYYIEDNETKNPITGRTPRQQRAYELRFDNAGKLTEFGLAEVRRDAYGAFVPTQYSNPEATTNPIDDYVGYYTIDKEGRPADWVDSKGNPLPWYEDDWFMMEHPDFYKEVYLGILGNKRRDYRRVPPTRELGAKYFEYLSLVSGYDRDKYRIANPDLDEWGVGAGIWTVTMTEKKRRLSITPSERFIEKLQGLKLK